MITGGTLFSGIGGAEYGAHLAGVEVDWRWQVELEPFCRDVLARHFTSADRSVTNVCEAGATILARVDVIAAGPPCPDFSVAGKGAGMAGDGGALLRETVRCVRELRPRALLLENVSGFLARGGLAYLVGALAACGYDAEWDCIPASAVGAPHQRDRVWVVAYPNSGGREQQRVGGLLDGERETQRGHPDGRSGPRHSGAYPDGTGSEDASWRRRSKTGRNAEPCGFGCRVRNPKWSDPRGWLPSSAVRRVDDGLPPGLDGPDRRRFARARRQRDRQRLKALGNAWVPQASVPAWRRCFDFLRFETATTTTAGHAGKEPRP